MLGSMPYPQSYIDELKRIHYDETGVMLSYAEAHEMISRLVYLIRLTQQHDKQSTKQPSHIRPQVD